MAKGDREVLDSIDQVAAYRFQRYAGYALDVLEALEEHGEGNFGFQPGQGCSEAKVNAMSKRDMPVGCASDVEAVRVGELRLITVGGADPGQHHLTGVYLLISNGGISDSSAIHELDR